VGETLSGGANNQRVALARVPKPQKPERVLLLDEPFGHIDTFLEKKSTERNLFGYLQKRRRLVYYGYPDATRVLSIHANRGIVLKDQEIMVNARTKRSYIKPKKYLQTATLFRGSATLNCNNIIKILWRLGTKYFLFTLMNLGSRQKSRNFPTTVEKCYLWEVTFFDKRGSPESTE